MREFPIKFPVILTHDEEEKEFRMQPEYIDCELAVIRNDAHREVIGYSIQCHGFRHSEEDFVTGLKSAGIECSLESSPARRVFIPFQDGIWETIASIFHEVALS